MTDTLIQRLRHFCGDMDLADTYGDAMVEAADALEQQAAQIEALQLTKAGLIDSLREEMDEGLRLRELGGALPDENITTMTERIIGERAAQAAELSALRADAERMRADLISCRGSVKTEHHHYERLSMVHGKTPHGECYWAEANRLGDLLDRIDSLASIDAALRQEQPTPLVEIGRRTTPCGECHLQPGECCDICGARDVSAQPAGEGDK